MEKLYIDRYNSFVSSLSSLEEAKYRDRTDSFVLSGIVQKFSLTFDLAWKLMKDILLQEYQVTDFALGSPSEVLKKSFENNLIDDDVWMTMLRQRNQLIHDYDGTIANDAVDDIVDNYISVFIRFKNVVGKLVNSKKSV